MPSIVRNLTHVLDNHVEDDRILIFNIDGEDSDGVPTAPTAPIAFPTCAGEGTIQDEAGAFHEGVSVERSRNPDGRREQEAKRDEDRPPTMGERQEPSIIVGSQTSASVEDSAQGSDNCVTLVDDGNQPERDAEHRRLSIVDVSYEDMSTPELSVGDDTFDTQSDFAISYDSEEDEGPVSIERTEDGTPYVSVMGVIVPVDHRQRRKRTRLVLEEEEDGISAPHTPMIESTVAYVYQGPVIAPADAPHAPKRPRYTRTPIDYVEHRNLAFQLRQTDFGEFCERVRQPLRVTTEDGQWYGYGYSSGSGSEVHVDLDHASLRDAPTPAPSPAGGKRLVYDYVDEEEDAYESEEEYEEDGYEEEYENEDEEHRDEEEEEGEEDEQERDDLATQFPVTVVEEEEDEDEKSEDEGTVADDL